MTSEERHERRYRRRKARREAKLRRRAAEVANYAKAMSFGNLRKWGMACCKGTAWKSSTQSFRLKIISNTAVAHTALMSGKLKFRGFICFDRVERGKVRHIKSVHITERQIRKTFNQEVAVPLIRPHLIYDNHASLKGRGTDRALNRLTCHLQRHFRQYGNAGYVVLYDFTDYFNSAPHDPVTWMYRHYIRDARSVQLGTYIMDLNGPVGFGLGCEMSQTNCIAIPNRLDHYVKQQLRVKGYDRYMDDGVALAPTLERAREIEAGIVAMAAALGIKMNPGKTRIAPVKSFTWLKTRFILTETGKVIKKPSRRSIVVMHRKLKKFKAWVDLGHHPKHPETPFTVEEARQSYMSCRGHLKRGNTYKVIKRLDGYFTDLFGEPPVRPEKEEDKRV